MRVSAATGAHHPAIITGSTSTSISISISISISDNDPPLQRASEKRYYPLQHAVIR
jgi:hypothetical protein